MFLPEVGHRGPLLFVTLPNRPCKGGRFPFPFDADFGNGVNDLQKI